MQAPLWWQDAQFLRDQKTLILGEQEKEGICFASLADFSHSIQRPGSEMGISEPSGMPLEDGEYASVGKTAIVLF